MDTIDPLRFVFAFLFVIGLIGALALGLKRYGKAQKFFAMPDENSRLKVVETRWIDVKRKLVLVKRDNVEHLLLVSDKGEQVIESGIKGDD